MKVLLFWLIYDQQNWFLKGWLVFIGLNCLQRLGVGMGGRVIRWRWLWCFWNLWKWEFISYICIYLMWLFNCVMMFVMLFNLLILDFGKWLLVGMICKCKWRWSWFFFWSWSWLFFVFLFGIGWVFFCRLEGQLMVMIFGLQIWLAR